MSTVRTVGWAIRIGLAAALAGFGIFLLVRAWDVPLEASGILFTPLAFVGAIFCFGSAVAIVVPRSWRGRGNNTAGRGAMADLFDVF